MANWKLWIHTLLIAAVLVGAAYSFWPTTLEAADTNTGHRETWELTGQAIQNTLDGNCEDMGPLDTCRERCLYGQPTGDFGCFNH